MIKNFTYYKHDENELGHIKGTPTRQEHLYENINQALKRIDNKLSLYDESYDWILYSSYGKGYIQTGEGKDEGYEYEKHWDYDLIIIERIKQSQYFGETQKDWFIYQNGGYSELYPELKCYANHFQWSSKEYSEVEIIEIAKKIASAITDFYIKREKDYREQEAFEQECFDAEHFCGRRFYCDEGYRSAFEDDPEAEWNID